MSTENNKELVRRWLLEGFNNCDLTVSQRTTSITVRPRYGDMRLEDKSSPKPGLLPRIRKS